MSFFIISLRHTHRSDPYMTLWRPNDAGYCYAKENAGTYDEPKKGYHDNEDNMPISADFDYFMTVKNPKYCGTEGGTRLMIPNCQAVWDEIGIKLTKKGFVRL